MNGCYGYVDGVCGYTPSDVIPVSSASIKTPVISDDVFPVTSKGETFTGYAKQTYFSENGPPQQRVMLDARYRHGSDDTANGVMTRYELDKEFSFYLEAWNTQLIDTVSPLGKINMAAADRRRDFRFTNYERTTVCDVETGYCDRVVGPPSFSMTGQVTQIEVFADGLPGEVPEPSSLALVALGLAAAAARRKRA